MRRSVDRKAAPALRREPTQVRAQQTIETIFEATAQIVVDEGVEALNTNRIAERAGFSIGTLYQYFPTKQAILLAMIERERARVLDQLTALMERATREAYSEERVVRDFIRTLIEAFGTGGPRRGAKLRSTLVRLSWQMDHNERVAASLRDGADRLAAFLQSNARGENNAIRWRIDPTAVFVTVRAVMGAIRSASLERSPLLGTDAFEDELVRLSLAMLLD